MAAVSNTLQPRGDRLRDFIIDARLIVLSLMALVIGAAGAGAAWVLLRLIALFTNLACFQRLSVQPVALSNLHLAPWTIAVPVVVVVCMARSGSAKIRGHGIPEAIEAILRARPRRTGRLISRAIIWRGVMRSWVIIFVASAIMGVAASAAAGAEPHFVETPKMVDEINRGIEDGLHCALQYLGPAQISNCAFAMARLNARDGSDTRAYNLGLTFETWRDLDVDWVSDQKVAKSGQGSQLRDEEAGAKSMYLFYRGARGALGISDAQLLALITKMTPAGKATASARLQFWANHAH
ncbi:MAG TPA: hypothetical protein VMF67_05695 [Rhizomicrobium sp.]|nr:hypothetical protein [Rhizomicrobium sp.]